MDFWGIVFIVFATVIITSPFWLKIPFFHGFYCWKVNTLADDLIRNNLTEFEKLKYLIATFIAYETLILTATPSSENQFNLRIIQFCLDVLFITLGTIVCYFANKNGDGKNFLERYICLSWPVGIRVFVFLAIVIIVPMIPFSIFSVELFPTMFSDENIYLTIIPTFVFYIFYFWRLRKWIIYVSINGKAA